MSQSTVLNLPSSDDMAQQFREDIEMGAAAQGLPIPPTGPGTHFGLTATAAGNLMSILIANQQLLDNDSNPLTAVGAALEQIRISDGLPEKPPVQARLALEVTVQGTVTIPAGLQWQGPGGVRGTIDSLTPNVTGTISVATTVVDAGSAGNLPTGTFVNFVNPPLNVQTQAKVLNTLSLGSDVESDENKRARIMEARQNPPEGGNWSHLRTEAAASSTNADGFWVYPSLGGPGATKVILTRTNPTTPLDRTVDVNGIDAVINAFLLKFPKEAQNLVVDTCINQPVGAWFKLNLATSGGAYWVDGTSAWPELPLLLAAIGGEQYMTSSLATGDASALAAAQIRHCVAWDNTTNTLIDAIVTIVGGTYPGPYTISIPGPSLDGYILAPKAPNTALYIAEMFKAFAAMGPGEYLAGTHPHYPRAHRRPEPNSLGPYVLNAVQTNAIQSAYIKEILEIDLQPSSPITPALPSNNADKPRILVPVNVAFFPGFP